MAQQKLLDRLHITFRKPEIPKTEIVQVIPLPDLEIMDAARTTCRTYQKTRLKLLSQDSFQN